MNMNLTTKVTFVFISSLFFLVSQIPIMILFRIYNIDLEYAIPLVWASGILCGLYSSYSIYYISKNKKVIKKHV